MSERLPSRLVQLLRTALAASWSMLSRVGARLVVRGAAHVSRGERYIIIASRAGVRVRAGGGAGTY